MMKGALMAGPRHVRTAIIGSGFGGIGLGIRLRQAGFEDFTILEKETSLGGTWRDNTYPGCACDVPSMSYCFSFAQKTDWTRKWAPQPEIQAYMEDIAHSHGIVPHIRFGVRFTGARFHASSGKWEVFTDNRDTMWADALVIGIGQLHYPYIPAIEGREKFRGVQFHSARWNHEFDFRGKRVAVIGNAASAIQFIPQIAPLTERLYIFQRSANWMLPRGDRPYRKWEHWAFAHVPGLAKFYRARLWAALELFFLPVIQQKPWAMRFYRRQALRYLEETVRDPQLRRLLVPDYPIGAKRILISDDYYQSLNLPQVRLVTDGVAALAEDAVVTKTGERLAVDAVIFATGFRTNPFLAGLRIEGLGGRLLENDWAQGARAYYGITVPGYPNFFLLYGPNTNLGHNSILFMLECQFQYILEALRLLQQGAAYLDVRKDVFEAFNRDIQAALQHTAWAHVDHSWYKDEAGRITNNWPYSTFWYWWKTRHLNAADYRIVSLAEAAAAAQAESLPFAATAGAR
ncbi:MAG: NAD(P)/FAD-dependent oxidoreductase [Candidatus Binatia bacterium]|nr:NAD(P)/FAD-dependent oxidoreductase [Candidatus Binatia bacterium]